MQAFEVKVFWNEFPNHCNSTAYSSTCKYIHLYMNSCKHLYVCGLSSASTYIVRECMIKKYQRARKKCHEILQTKCLRRIILFPKRGKLSSFNVKFHCNTVTTITQRLLLDLHVPIITRKIINTAKKYYSLVA